MYRMQKIDARTTFMHWQIHKDGAADWRGMGDRLDVAVALGCDPITTYSASAPLPKHIDELMLAGFFRGEPVELVKAKTVDLEVPANAEIVLEGYIEKGELGTEGPFGDHTGYYSPEEPFPIFHLTAMTMRRDAIYPSIVVGVPPQEDAWLGKATERIFLPAVRMTVPEIVDYDLPGLGRVPQLRDRLDPQGLPRPRAQGDERDLGSRACSRSRRRSWSSTSGSTCTTTTRCSSTVGANVDPKRDVVLGEGPLDQLDHAAAAFCYGGKLGIDATHKLEAEGGRPWPERIEMTAEVRELVDRRWAEYGFGAGSG